MALSGTASAPLEPIIGGDAATRLLSLACLIAAWWIAARCAASPNFLPSPQTVLHVVWSEALTGALPLNLAITLARVAAAFILSMAIGTAAGYLAGCSSRANALLDPPLVIALNLPVLIVIILAYVWIGMNDVAAVLAVSIAKIPTIMVTLREGTRALDPGLAEVSVVYRLSRSRRWRLIVLPQLAPYLAAAARSGLSVTWKIVLIVELLGRPNGVGFALNMFFQNFDVAGILAYGLCFAAVMLVVESVLLQPWERRANAWRRAA